TDTPWGTEPCCVTTAACRRSTTATTSAPTGCGLRAWTGTSTSTLRRPPAPPTRGQPCSSGRRGTRRGRCLADGQQQGAPHGTLPRKPACRAHRPPQEVRVPEQQGAVPERGRRLPGPPEG